MSFSATTKVKTITSSGILIAEARTKSGNPNETRINLDKKIGNIDGKFSFGGSGFSKTARSIRVTQNGILSAHLRRKNGSFNKVMIDLNQYIMNDNGTLKWVQQNDLDLLGWLKTYKLDRYADNLREQGAESLGDLRDLDDEETKELAVEAKMKPIHLNKFLKACKELRDGVDIKGSSSSGDVNFDYFLQECGCMRYKSVLLENGLRSPKDLKDLCDDDIKLILGDAKLGPLHKKKFMKLVTDYKNGKFIPGKTFSSMNQPQVAEKPQYESPQQMNAMMGGLNQMMGGLNTMINANTANVNNLMHGGMNMLNTMMMNQPNMANNHMGSGRNMHTNMRMNIGQCQSTEIIETNEKCPKCKGNGWLHQSNMNHKGKASMRCFFCEDCNGCNGTGMVKTKKKITKNGFGQRVGVKNLMITCPSCKGNAFVHKSAMKHKTGDMNKRCFFCEDCNRCRGKGRIENK